MMPADVARFEPQRRYATLAAMAREAMSTVTDEIIDMHDRIIGKVFNGAKNRHQQQFQASGKAINSKLRLYGCIGQRPSLRPGRAGAIRSLPSNR